MESPSSSDRDPDQYQGTKFNFLKGLFFIINFYNNISAPYFGSFRFTNIATSFLFVVTCF